MFEVNKEVMILARLISYNTSVLLHGNGQNFCPWLLVFSHAVNSILLFFFCALGKALMPDFKDERSDVHGVQSQLSVG